ncbi:MFS transporter [Halomonas sp. PR-M31]|uniref:MFS transporter n=1 Tax=Halomonas sp. PR-M31 TaxID=1471202 RepID=UPI00065007EA|nr:MFS transporter [Halomonas sp. PR-M31]
MATALTPPCDESLRTRSDHTPCSRKRGVLAATILGSSLAFVVGAIINVALPAMQTSFATNAAGAQWIVNAYLLPLGALVLMGGALGDHYGRKRVFLLGLVVFTFGCLACALAPNLTLLLAARALQGVGAALLAPNSLAIIAASFSGEARGKAVGTWAAVGAMAGAAAPVLGGWLVDVASWRWAFLIVVPPAAAAFLIGRWAITESRENARITAPLDWLGAALATAALGVLIWALIAFPERGIVDPAVLLAFMMGAILVVAFLIVEHRKGSRAMMPLALFATSSFAGISLLTLFLYAALGGLLVLLPYTLISGFGFTATAAGAAILPFPLTMGLLSRYTGGLAQRIGIRWILTIGPLGVAVGFALIARLPAQDFNYWSDIFPALLIIAVGMAVSVAPLTTAVMNSVADDFVGVASGVNNAIARSAGLIATALLGLVLIDAGKGDDALIDGFAGAAFVGAGMAAVSALAAALLIRVVASPEEESSRAT